MTKKTSTPTKPPARDDTPAWATTTSVTATARSPWMSSLRSAPPAAGAGLSPDGGAGVAPRAGDGRGTIC